jgi:hypothetical protein
MIGDIVLVPFPNSDLTNGKLRPAVVLYEEYRNCEGIMSGKREIACGVDVHRGISKFYSGKCLSRQTYLLLKYFSFDLI